MGRRRPGGGRDTAGPEGPGAADGPERLWPLALVTFVDAVGLGLLVPMLAFFVQSFGASAATITQLVAVYAVGTLIGGPLLGRLSDRVDRRWVVAFSMAGLAVSYTGMAWSPSLMLVFLFRAFGGVMAGNESVVQAIVTRNVPPEARIGRIGAIGAARGAGMILGPVLGGVGALFVEDASSYYRLTLACAAMLCIVAGGLVVATVRGGGRSGRSEAGRPDRRSAARALHRLPKSVLWMVTLTAAVAFAFGILQSITALYVQASYGWGPIETGQILGLCAALIVFARLYLARVLARTFGSETVLAVCFVCGFASMSALSPGQSWPALVCLYSVFCLSYGVVLVLTTSTVATLVPDARRGAALGVNQGAFAGAIVVSAMLSGSAFERIHTGAPFLSGAIVLSVPTALLVWGAVTKPSEQMLRRGESNV